MTKKILLLTHSFPPYVFPESFLITKKLGNLPGYCVDVVTIHNIIPDIKKDIEFQQIADMRFNSVTRVQPYSFYKKLPFTKLESFFSLPDPYVFLLPLYLKHIKDLSSYSAIFTWSMYHSIHLLGLYIKNKYPFKPWITHFSDPWSKNPYFQRKKWVLAVNKKLEEIVLRKSDAHIFTSQETIDYFAYNNDETILKKANVVPHAFDESLYKNGEKTDSKFIIRHLGNFYGSRRPEVFLKALEEINSKNSEIFKNVQIEFYGTGFNKEAVDRFILPDDLVIIKEPVSYLESLKLMKTSDLLLVIDAPLKDNPFLPSKIIDYIGSKTPIFSVTPAGPTQYLSKKLDFLTASPSNEYDIAEKFEICLRNIRNSKKSIDPHIQENFSKSSIQKKILSILNNASSKCIKLNIIFLILFI